MHSWKHEDFSSRFHFSRMFYTFFGESICFHFEIEKLIIIFLDFLTKKSFETYDDQDDCWLCWVINVSDHFLKCYGRHKTIIIKSQNKRFEEYIPQNIIWKKTFFSLNEISKYAVKDSTVVWEQSLDLVFFCSYNPLLDIMISNVDKNILIFFDPLWFYFKTLIISGIIFPFRNCTNVTIHWNFFFFLERTGLWEVWKFEWIWIT